MTDLLNRFGPVVDISGLDADQILDELSSPVRAGRDRHLSRRQHDHVSPRWPQALHLPFHSVESAVALTDKYEQRQVLGEAGLPVPPCEIVRPDAVRAGSGCDRVRGGLAGRSQAPLGPGESVHLLRSTTRRSWITCSMHWGRPARTWSSRGISPTTRPGRTAPTRRTSPWRASPRAGVVSHLALTGRFPDGGELPRDRVLHPGRTRGRRPGGGARAGHLGHRGARCAHGLPPHRNQVHPRRTPGHRGERPRRRRRAGDARSCGGLPLARVDPAAGARRGDPDRRPGGHPTASATGSSCSRRRCRPPWRRSRGWTP